MQWKGQGKPGVSPLLSTTGSLLATYLSKSCGEADVEEVLVEEVLVGVVLQL